jgi:hypothetical protein
MIEDSHRLSFDGCILGGRSMVGVSTPAFGAMNDEVRADVRREDLVQLIR